MTSIIKQIIALISAILISFGIYTSPSTADPIIAEDPNTVTMQVALLSDPQFIANDKGEWAFREALEDVGNNESALDGLVVAGDLTEAGDDITNDIFMNLMKNTNVKKKILVAGNHDIRFFYSYTISRFINNVNTLKSADYTVDKPYYYTIVNGYYFIVLGSDKQELDSAHIGDEQLKFLDETLAIATKNNQPAFVVCHQPYYSTITTVKNEETGKKEDQAGKIIEVMDKYDNVFYLFGHTHSGFGGNTYGMLENSKTPLINIPSIGKESSRGYDVRGTGFVMEVYPDRVVFRSRNFAEGQYLGGEHPEFDRTYYLSK